MQDQSEIEKSDALHLDNLVPEKPAFWSTHVPLFLTAVVLSVGFLALGYSIGHRQGLSVVGYDADAQELAEVVTKQKSALDAVNKSLNSAVQERDIAISNFNDLYTALTQSRTDRIQFESLNVFYREVLRRRGGVGFTIQNLTVKPLPENAFEYQLDMVQISPNKLPIKGRAEIRLLRGNAVLTVPMESSDFDFQDYARLTGRWTMPKGFVPQFIEVHVDLASGPVVKRYRWQKGAEIDSPGNFVSEIPQATANSQ